MEVIATIPLHIGMEDLCTSIWFCIVNNFATNVLLGKMDMDNFLTGIFPTERRIVPLHSLAVAILVSNQAPPRFITSVSNDVERLSTGDD